MVKIAKKEITSEVYLPQKFLKLYTDELADIGRKLDKGNELLTDIKRDTRILPEILPGIKNGIENQNVKFDSFITVQMDHNKRLEKILEKLAEK